MAHRDDLAVGIRVTYKIGYIINIHEIPTLNLHNIPNKLGKHQRVIISKT